MGSSNANLSKALLTYTADPLKRGNATTYETETTTPIASLTQSDPQVVSTYAYKIKFYKHDKSNGELLPGAKFTVQVKDDAANDAFSKGKYVNRNGELVDAPASGYIWTEDDISDPEPDPAPTVDPSSLVFTTGDGDNGTYEGVFFVNLIDEGKYEIREIKAPENYALVETHIEIYITAKETTGNTPDPSVLHITESGGDKTPINSSDTKLANMISRAGYFDVSTQGHKIDGQDAYNAVVATTGQIEYMTVNTKQITMPLTGLPGYVGVAALGVVLVLVGFGGIFLLRRGRAKRDLV